MAARLILAALLTNTSPRDLTAEGTVDWYAAATDLIQKDGGSAIASTAIGAEGPDGTGILYNWTNGPSGSVTGSSVNLGRYYATSGHGREFVVDVGTTPQLINIDFTADSGVATLLTASVSDDSSPDVALRPVPVSGVAYYRAVFVVEAGTAGQTVTIQLKTASAGVMHWSAISVANFVGTLNLIDHDDANILNSPGNWYDDGSHTVSATPGAYRRLEFSALTNLMLNFAAIGAGAVSVAWRVDNGAFNIWPLTSDTTISLATGLDGEEHVVEIVLEALSGNDRWTTLTGALKIASFVADDDAVLIAATAKPKIAYLFGDSGWEGYNINNDRGWTNNFANSALRAGPRAIAAVLDAEYGQIANSGVGWTRAGINGMPSFEDSYGFYYDGASRLDGGGLFIDQPDYVFIRLGQNDLTLAQGDVEDIIGMIRAAAPDASIFIMPCAPVSYKSTLAAAVAAITDANLYFVDTESEIKDSFTGLNGNLYSGDGNHVNLLGSQIDIATIVTTLKQALRRFNVTPVA